MKPNISEFSYGYALTEELIQFYNSSGMQLTAAPIFPSLYQEGQPGGGYDLRLNFPGFPLFLQFKLADCIKRRSNRVIECSLGLLNVPFYRMHLRPSRQSNQHQLLLDLENQGNMVFYVAPAFHEPRELNRAYLTRRVASRSKYWTPSSIGALPDGMDHHIAFRHPGPAYFLSDPIEIHSIILEEIIELTLNKLRTSITLEEILRKTADNMYHMIQKRILKNSIIDSKLFHLMENASNLQKIAYFARTFFDCRLIIIQGKSK